MTAVLVINYNNSICRIFLAIWHHLYQPLAQHEGSGIALHSRMMSIKTKVLDANETNSKGVCCKDSIWNLLYVLEILVLKL